MKTYSYVIILLWGEHLMARPPVLAQCMDGPKISAEDSATPDVRNAGERRIQNEIQIFSSVGRRGPG
jgi:hypothetical protein